MNTKIIVLFIILLTASADTWALPAFPGAVGFGSDSVAGSGRHLKKPHAEIVTISSLDDSGPGTLRDCLSRSGPRTCVFEVSGQIKLSSELKIKSPYVTIAGQTAPPPGILVSRAGIRIETHDVLIQHITVRVGDDSAGPKPENRDAITVGASKGSVFNIVLDHLSLGWAIDENFSTWKDTYDVTLSNSFIVEGLDNSIHPKGPHSKGALIGDGTKRISLIRNLLANNIERNPYLKPATSTEVVNNLVYGWGPGGGWSLCNVSDNTGTGLPLELILVGNVYKPGPVSARVPALYGKAPAPKTKVYVHDNLGPTRPNSSLEDWKIASIPESPFRSEIPPFSGSGVPVIPASQVEATVLKSSGSRPGQRLSIDSRIVEEISKGTGSIKDCVEGCKASAGGWPVVKETSVPLNIPENPFLDDDKDGYTNLEEWLHSLSIAVSK